MAVSLSPPPRRMRRRLAARIALVAVEAFVAVGAVYGSVMLITDAWRLDPAMLRDLPFDTWVLPGIALAALVAVPNVVAGILVARGHPRARIVSILTGGILIGWIVVQLALIQQYFYLQPVMGVCGLLTIGLAYRLPAGEAS
jgi:hypothetical protein